jgi:hypothetical protein
MKTHTHIAKAAAVAAMVLLASCSMPVQVPAQTQQQQQNTQTFIDQLRKLVQGPSQTSKAYPWEEFVPDPLLAPQPLPQVVWPALGAGDFPQTLPPVVWPAPGAGDFQTVKPAPVAGINPNIVIPELLTSVVWPETAAPRPIYWHTVGVDERELVPPVAAPVNVAPPAPRAVPAGIRPETLEPVGDGKTDLIRVPGPVDDCPIRPAAGPC